MARNKRRKEHWMESLVIIFLGIMLPLAFLGIVGILVRAAACEIISWKEFRECIQITGPMWIPYISAILAYAFNGNVPLPVNKAPRTPAQTAAKIIRIGLSLVIPGCVMLLGLAAAWSFASAWITFDGYKIWAGINSWVLSGCGAYIITQYFGTLPANLSPQETRKTSRKAKPSAPTDSQPSQ